jgi:hypothetical protein
MEVIGGSYRSTVGIGMQLFFAVGFMSLPGIAYFIREWNYLQLAISLPALITIIYFWYSPSKLKISSKLYLWLPILRTLYI